MRALRLAQRAAPRALMRTTPVLARSIFTQSRFVAPPSLIAAPALLSAGSASFCSAATNIHSLEATAIDGSKVGLDIPKPMIIVNVASQ